MDSAIIDVQSSALGNQLYDLLMSQDIQPGDDPSYQVCKLIYTYHPLGSKMVERPLRMAMSQEREISIPGSPETMVKEAFQREWANLGADALIFNTMRLARIYGVGALVIGADGKPTNEPIDPWDLPGLSLYFNVLDPLNTAGSLVLNQNPNAPDFQKRGDITAADQVYHRSRACVVMNEEPIYIQFTTSAFGFVGRSVYQRALYPLKSFIQSMITDDMVTRKAGVLIAKMKQIGSFIDNVAAKLANYKRNLLKEAKTDNVISISNDENIETLNMQNADAAMTVARKNILENIAAAADMPAKLLNNETFAEGFGEGSEDAKDIVRYCHGLRKDMQPLYDFMDKIVRYRAWNREFYKMIQNNYPEYQDVEYETAFYQWYNAFVASWPSLIEEPESEKIKVEDTKLKAVIALLETLMPQLDPANKAKLIEWAQDNYNELKLLFPQPLDLDIEALANYTPPQPANEPGPPKPFGGEA